MVVADSFHREVAAARMGLAKTYFVRALDDKLKFESLEQGRPCSFFAAKYFLNFQKIHFAGVGKRRRVCYNVCKYTLR